MIGTTLEELKDKLLHGHEAEFTYDGCEYSIESEMEEGESVIKIWKYNAEPRCITKAIVRNEKDLEKLLNEKCFQNKTFLEIEDQITVETIF